MVLHLNLQSIKYGDNITISGIENLAGTISNQRSDVCELKIAGVLDSFEPYVPQNYQLKEYNTAIVIMLNKEMYEKDLENDKINSIEIYCSTEKPYEIDKKINEYGISGDNLYDERLEEESNIKLLRFLLYTLDIMITIFCMSNIFYIISASTLFRKKDFAILRSLGMSERKINKMFILEGFFYGISGIIIGTLLSIWILYLVGEFTIDKELYIFEYPFIQIIYAIILVYAVIFFAMLSARRKIKDRNIIEDVKNDIN